MEKILKRALNVEVRLNESYLEVSTRDYKDVCRRLSEDLHALLRLMFATDERERDGFFRIYAVFSIPGADRFIFVVLSVPPSNPRFPSITPYIPAAHWYEREISDLFGLAPQGHPDQRRLVFHEAFPADSHPLRKDWTVTAAELNEWGAGTAIKVPHPFMEVAGEGIVEIPVGPVHAGIIEPGHFRFSAIGETIFFLEPRLFYTHKGTEKHFEGLGFIEGAKLAERVSGTSSFSHGAAYCMAVERMMGIEITEKAAAVRTLVLELERLYNHIGDIGNMCAGTAFALGYMKGAIIKERLMQLNERLTGSRYLRGLNVVGGVTKDVFDRADDILRTVDEATGEYKELMDLLLGSVSHIERLQNTGRLSKDIARKLGRSEPERRAKYDVHHARISQDRWRLVTAGAKADNDYETEQQIRLTVLEVLYTRRRLEPESHGLSPLDLERLIGRAREQLEFTIWYLVQKKYVTRGDSAMLTITADGAEYLENNYQNSLRQRRLTAARTA